MTDTPKRVILWCAVSSEDQTGDKKVSIPDQLARQHERANRNGWLVVDVIIVEGFSRRFYTYREFAEAAAADGHTDPSRMFDHWRLCDFDILSCRDLSRLGREQSILSEVIARTIDSGAVIIPLDEAPIDANNYRMHSAISGVGASEHIDKLKRWRDTGMKARAARGEMVGSRVPKFYILDDNKVMQPDRANFQRFFDDFAELFLAGTSYNALPEALANRGHRNPENGKLLDAGDLRRFLFSVRTWGGAEYNRTGVKRGHDSKRSELWAIGRAEPPPDVYVKWNVCEPVWLGSQADAVKDELERRFYAIRGSARPHDTYAFTGLCICGDCGRTMVVQHMRRPYATYAYLDCPNGHKRRGCQNYKLVRFEKVKEAFDDYITYLKTNPDHTPPDTPKADNKLTTIDKEITRITARLNNLIDLISAAPVSARADYQAKIDALTSQRDTLRDERLRLSSLQRDHEDTQRARLAALESLQSEDIWQKPTPEQNQLLRKLLGNARVVCEDGAVSGIRRAGS